MGSIHSYPFILPRLDTMLGVGVGQQTKMVGKEPALCFSWMVGGGRLSKRMSESSGEIQMYEYH